jgi:hypothetical protein
MKLSVLLIVAALAITPWIWNGVKFLSCDFESDYKCEAVHGAGVLIPPVSFITVWFDDDSAT